MNDFKFNLSINEIAHLFSDLYSDNNYKDKLLQFIKYYFSTQLFPIFEYQISLDKIKKGPILNFDIKGDNLYLLSENNLHHFKLPNCETSVEFDQTLDIAFFPNNSNNLLRLKENRQLDIISSETDKIIKKINLCDILNPNYRSEISKIHTGKDDNLYLFSKIESENIFTVLNSDFSYNNTIINTNLNQIDVFSISNNSDIYFITLEHELGKFDKFGKLNFLKSVDDLKFNPIQLSYSNLGTILVGYDSFGYLISRIDNETGEIINVSKLDDILENKISSLGSLLLKNENSLYFNCRDKNGYSIIKLNYNLDNFFNADSDKINNPKIISTINDIKKMIPYS